MYVRLEYSCQQSHSFPPTLAESLLSLVFHSFIRACHWEASQGRGSVVLGALQIQARDRDSLSAELFPTQKMCVYT